MGFKNGQKVKVIKIDTSDPYDLGDSVTVDHFDGTHYWCVGNKGDYFMSDWQLSELKTDLKDLEKKYEELGKEIEALKEEDLSVDLQGFEFGCMTTTTECGIDVIRAGEYSFKGFYLRGFNHDWELKEDETGQLCLIPTKNK